jgi:hypothetical protein
MDNNYQDIVAGYKDEELLIMVYQFDQWDTEMLIAVENELNERNILPDNLQLKKNTLIQNEHEFLLIGKEATFSQQFLGWIGIVGILGIIIGYELYFSKTKSRYTDTEYFKYNVESRESGRFMFYISMAFIGCFLFYKISVYIENQF